MAGGSLRTASLKHCAGSGWKHAFVTPGAGRLGGEPNWEGAVMHRALKARQ